MEGILPWARVDVLEAQGPEDSRDALWADLWGKQGRMHFTTNQFAGRLGERSPHALHHGVLEVFHINLHNVGNGELLSANKLVHRDDLDRFVSEVPSGRGPDQARIRVFLSHVELSCSVGLPDRFVQGRDVRHPVQLNVIPQVRERLTVGLKRQDATLLAQFLCGENCIGSNIAPDVARNSARAEEGSFSRIGNSARAPPTGSRLRSSPGVRT